MDLFLLQTTGTSLDVHASIPSFMCFSESCKFLFFRFYDDDDDFLAVLGLRGCVGFSVVMAK